ncbi:MAG: DegT/DnrJ/EryC1/StrS family aminotransferase [Rhodomicrobium sp.]
MLSNLSSEPSSRPPRPIAFIDLTAQQTRIRDRLDRAMARVLDHGQYIMGPEVEALEMQLAAFTGVRHALTCSSGTDALLIALMALGVRKGDAVLCPSFTYTATPETIALLGATPIFIDVDPDTFNVDPAGLTAGLEAARAHNMRPAGLIAVDLFGLPADYSALAQFANAHGLFLLSDAAQSFGATLDNRRVGTFGIISATSFFPAKPLGCYGDGGAIFTEDDGFAARMSSIRQHGKAEGADKYAIDRIGLNGRLDTLQAAILIEKLAIFPEEIEMRQLVADRYTAGLSDVALTPKAPATSRSVWAQYTLRIPGGKRDAVAAQLKACGVPTAIYYPRPLHHQQAYAHFPKAFADRPVSERLCTEVLSLPIHPYLLPVQQDYIIECVRQAVG